MYHYVPDVSSELASHLIVLCLSQYTRTSNAALAARASHTLGHYTTQSELVNDCALTYISLLIACLWLAPFGRVYDIIDNLFNIAK